MVSDSHIKRIKRNDFNKELHQGKIILHFFSGANVKQLSHNIIPTLVNGKPDSNVIPVSTNDILNQANQKDTARSIIYIGLYCKCNGVNEVFILSIMVKENPNLTGIVCQINDMPRNLFEKKNGFHFICNDVITTN